MSRLMQSPNAPAGGSRLVRSAAVALAATFTLSPLSAPGEEADPDEEEIATISVMTFNVRFDNPGDGDNAWPMRRDAVAAFLEAEQPDIVGVQEALAHQLEFLLQAEPTFASVGVGRDDGKEAGEFSPILYRKARFAVLNSGTLWLSDTPEVVGSATWGNTITRIVTWARLRDEVTGGTLLVFNTHFDHQSQPSREKSAAFLVAQVAERRGEGEPVVVMGDFNAGETNTAMETLRAGGLVDTFRVLHPDSPEPGTFHGFHGTPGREKIDHVFVTPSVAVHSATVHRDPVDGRQISDHFPVSAVIAVPADPGEEAPETTAPATP